MQWYFHFTDEEIKMQLFEVFLLTDKRHKHDKFKTSGTPEYVPTLGQILIWDASAHSANTTKFLFEN